jgi:CRP/FNR family cyclic AMP-dependent transcriptional regulator
VDRLDESVATAVTSSRLLAGLSDEIVDDFLASAQMLQLAKGDTAFVGGHDSDCLFLVVSGKFKVHRADAEAHDNIFSIIGPGELLGELSLFDGLPRHATATALRASDVARMENENARAWVKRHPEELLLRFAQLFVSRIRNTHYALADVYGVDVATRVARALISQVAKFGRPTPVGPRLELDLSQEELALFVRASRERVNQVMADFVKRRWIERDGRELVFLDFEALNWRAHYNEHDNRHRSRKPQDDII